MAEARRTLRALLDEVAAGHEVMVMRRGQEVARLVPPKPSGRRRLPPLGSFRASIQIKGGPISRLVARSRRESRY